MIWQKIFFKKKTISLGIEICLTIFLLRTVELISFLSLQKIYDVFILDIKNELNIEHPLLLPIKCLFYNFHALI